MVRFRSDCLKWVILGTGYLPTYTYLVRNRWNKGRYQKCTVDWYLPYRYGTFFLGVHVSVVESQFCFKASFLCNNGYLLHCTYLILACANRFKNNICQPFKWISGFVNIEAIETYPPSPTYITLPIKRMHLLQDYVGGFTWNGTYYQTGKVGTYLLRFHKWGWPTFAIDFPLDSYRGTSSCGV